MILGLSKPQNIVFDGNTSEVLVRRKSGNKIQGAFSAISVLNNKKRVKRTMQPDIFDLLDSVSKGAFSVFNKLKYNRSEDNNITNYLADDGMSKTDKEVLSRRVRELKNVGLIRAVKKEIPESTSSKVFRFSDPRKTFIINPVMIRCSNHDEAMYLWDQCA
jgi:hypothetical protein